MCRNHSSTRSFFALLLNASHNVKTFSSTDYTYIEYYQHKSDQKKLNGVGNFVVRAEVVTLVRFVVLNVCSMPPSRNARYFEIGYVKIRKKIKNLCYFFIFSCHLYFFFKAATVENPISQR